MKALVLYHSRGGKTAGLARHVALGVEAAGGSPILRTCDEVTLDDFRSANCIIAGSPVYFGTMASQLKAALESAVSLRKQMEGKVGAAFATGGNESGGKETTILSILQCMLIYGMLIVGDPMAAGGHYGVATTAPESTAATENAFKLGERVATLAQRVIE